MQKCVLGVLTVMSGTASGNPPKRLRNVSGRRSTSRMNVGCGPVTGTGRATVTSRFAGRTIRSRLRERIGTLGNWLMGIYPPACLFAIAATLLVALDLITCSWERKRTIYEMLSRKGATQASGIT